MSDFRCMIVDVEHERIDPAAALEFVADPAFGGFAMFLGRVREQNQGRAVVGVSYDVFEQLALAGFDDIVRRAQEQFGPRLKIHLAHARGRLGVGDVAVVVAVGTPHRDEAFRACRQVIEAVKHRSPIWKQEHYQDGSSEWSEGCSLCETQARDDQPESRHDGHAHG